MIGRPAIHHGLANLAPPSGLLAMQPLLTTDGWSGFAFALPASPTKDIAKWVTTTLDRRIAEQDFSASVVAPVDAYQLSDGTWAVTTPAEAITMSFVFCADGPPPPTLTVVHSTAGKSQSASLNSVWQAHLQIPNPHSGWR